MNISYRTNTDILFFHCIDYAALWHFHVSDLQNRTLKSLMNFTKEDQKQLDKYKQYRKKLKWQDESELFYWADNNFRPNTKYPEIYEVLEYFKKRSLRDYDKTLPNYFEEKAKITKKIKKEILNSKDYLHYQELTNKILDLFPLAEKEKEVLCFLAYSPEENSVQGGANGTAIYTEVNEDLYKNSPQVVISLIIHEYAHKVSNSYEYLTTKRTQEENKFFKSRKKGCHSYEASIFEEIVMHILSEVYVRNLDVKRMEEVYKKRKDVYLQTIWKGVEIFHPIISDYLEDKYTSSETLEKLIITYRDNV